MRARAEYVLEQSRGKLIDSLGFGMGGKQQKTYERTSKQSWVDCGNGTGEAVALLYLVIRSTYLIVFICAANTARPAPGCVRRASAHCAHAAAARGARANTL